MESEPLIWAGWPAALGTSWALKLQWFSSDSYQVLPQGSCRPRLKVGEAVPMQLFTIGRNRPSMTSIFQKSRSRARPGLRWPQAGRTQDVLVITSCTPLDSTLLRRERQRQAETEWRIWDPLHDCCGMGRQDWMLWFPWVGGRHL